MYPSIESKMDDIMFYVKGAEVIIHNAPFDTTFLNAELNMSRKYHKYNWGRFEDNCIVTDTLIMARRKHPNQKKDPSKFQAVLEYRVNEIHRNRFKFGSNLMSMNKEIIKQ